MQRGQAPRVFVSDSSGSGGSVSVGLHSRHVLHSDQVGTSTAPAPAEGGVREGTRATSGSACLRKPRQGEPPSLPPAAARWSCTDIGVTERRRGCEQAGSPVRRRERDKQNIVPSAWTKSLRNDHHCSRCRAATAAQQRIVVVYRCFYVRETSSGRRAKRKHARLETTSDRPKL